MAGKPRIPEAEWESICSRYKSHEDVGAIANSYGFGREVVYRILRKRGIPLEKRGGSPPIPEESRLEICRLYQDKRGATSLASKFGITKRSVYNILSRAGIGTRPQNDRLGDTYHIPAYHERWVKRERRGHLRGPKGRFNHDAFYSLDEPACYWAGYLITDGCIGAYDGRSYKLYLPQARKHREQCEKLKSYLQSDMRIDDHQAVTFGKPRDFSSFSCTLPDEVAQRLLKLGIKPAKTALARAADGLLSKSAFWRGVVDGDGSCFPMRLTMHSSSCKLANQYRRAIESTGIVHHSDWRVYRNQAGVWMIRTRPQQSSLVANYLYNGADPTCRLERKYANALLLIAYGQNKSSRG